MKKQKRLKSKLVAIVVLLALGLASCSQRHICNTYTKAAVKVKTHTLYN